MPTVSCSTSSLTSALTATLSKHHAPSFTAPNSATSAPQRSSSRFKSLILDEEGSSGVNSQFDVFAYGSHAQYPASQVDALSPDYLGAEGGSTFTSTPAFQPVAAPVHHARPTIEEQILRPPSTIRVAADEDEDEDDDLSACWSPEQQTLLALQQQQQQQQKQYLPPATTTASTDAIFNAAWARSTGFSSISTASSSLDRRHVHTATYSYPSSDEAASLSASTSHSASYASTPARESSMARAQSQAHPLTLQPSLDSAWNFERLVSDKGRERRKDGRRRWVDDDDEDAMIGLAPDQKDARVGRWPTTRRTQAIGRPKKSALSSSSAVMESGARQTDMHVDGAQGKNVDAHAEDRERVRQRAVYEVMRKSAMERLALFSGHMGVVDGG